MHRLIVVLILAFCGLPLLAAQKTTARTKVSKQAASKVFSRQFRKSAMIALQARSKYADSVRNMDDKRQWDMYRDEAERTSVVDKMDDKRRTDAYKDEADKASVVANADAENSADKRGFLCLMKYENLVLNSKLARDNIRLWQLKTMFKEPVPNPMILDEAAQDKKQTAAGEALQDMLDTGEIRDCP
jgi:hypothetical protein